MKKHASLTGVAVVASMVLLAVVFIMRAKGFIGGIPCSKLPTVAEAERVVKEHRDVVDRIKQVRLGYIEFGVDSYQFHEKCPGKAVIAIMYPSEKDRIKIEQIICDDAFFGVPCVWHNI